MRKVSAIFSMTVGCWGLLVIASICTLSVWQEAIIVVAIVGFSVETLLIIRDLIGGRHMKKRELEKELRHAREWQEFWRHRHLEKEDENYTVRTENLHLLVELLELPGQLKTAECEIEDLEYTLRAVTENAEYKHAFDREDNEDLWKRLDEKDKEIERLEKELGATKESKHHWKMAAKGRGSYYKDKYVEVSKQLAESRRSGENRRKKVEDLEYTFGTENAECQSFWERACHDNFVLLREKTEQNRQLENELYEIKQPRDNTWQAEAIYWKEMYHDWKKEDTAELTAKDKEIRRSEKKLKTRRGEERDGWSKCRVLCAWGVPFSLVSTGDLSDNLCGPVTIWQYHEIRRLSCVKTISLGDGYCAIVYRGLKERDRIMDLLG